MFNITIKTFKFRIWMMNFGLGLGLGLELKMGGNKQEERKYLDMWVMLKKFLSRLKVTLASQICTKTVD